MSRFRLALDASPTATLMVDRHGIIVYANTQTERLLGYAPNELRGQSVEMLVPESLRGAHVTHRDAYHPAPTPRVMGAMRDLVARHKDGSDVPVEIGLNPVDTEDGAIVVATVVDLTRRREAEAAKNELIAHLENALREIRLLRGLIPVCAKCKKVREGDGYWRHIEEYLEAHAGVEITHGYCPDCGKAIFGEFWESA